MGTANNDTAKSSMKSFFQLAGWFSPQRVAPKSIDSESDTEFLGYESFSRINAELLKEAAADPEQHPLSRKNNA